jgi:ribonuclease E
MAKEICISTTPHETRLAIIEDDQLAEVYYERENEYTLAGSIYKGRVTRVLPGMQSSFVDLGLERDAFLYVTDFLEDSEDADEYETSTPKASSLGHRAATVTGEEPATAEEPRAEREGGRRGRRDGRGRGRGERPAIVAETAPPEASAPQPTQPAEPTRRQRAAEERAAATAALRAAQPETKDREEKGDDEVSDETPDGTRRWRGRRGRRRGGMRAGVLGGTPAPPSEANAGDTALFELPERGAPGGTIAATANSEFPSFGSVAEDTTPASSSSEAVDIQAAAIPERAGRGRSERNADRPDRGERSRDRRPSTDAAPASGSGAIVLPGESLQKYGASPASAQPAPAATAKLQLPQRPVNYTPPRPATLVEAVTGWDGGAVMPGETLSRHRTPSATPAQPVEPAQSTEAVHQIEPTDPAAATHHDSALPTEKPELTFDDAVPESVVESEPVAGVIHHVEPDATYEAAPETHSESQHAAHEHATEDHAVEEDYNPTEGQASVRFTPPTSELRFSQLFGGRSEPAPEPPAPKEQEREHGIPVEPEQPARTTLQAGTDAANTAHIPKYASEIAVEETSTSSWNQQSAEEEASRHISAMQQEKAGDGFTELVDQLQGFAPGSGLLEEEVIDEDEYDFDPVHAHADEDDLEDIEEETMDGHNPAAVPPVFHGTLHTNGKHNTPDSDSSSVSVARFDEDEEEPSRFALEAMELDEDEEEEAAPGQQGSGDAAPRRERGAEPGRQGGRNGRNAGRSGGRGRMGGGGGRRSAQTQDLPIISDLLKPGQEILVQIAKEPIAKKGARITSHIALPGRFLVFMPTVSHVGVSRKIASDEERQRLKRILLSEKGENSGGFIVRTAAEGASEEELRADLRFLISLWNEIKQRADTAKAPALIYHDLNLVERILRDQVSSNFSAIWVDTEQEYERIVRFLNRFQPSLVRRVKLYTKETPLFEHFGIQEEISKALKAKVWLKSGGSIVINQTEALVAIDINTGKYVGKTARLEDTIVKTNLDAIPEIVRQIRLRDLGGIIIIDFIDMDERKNRHRVLAALEEAMKVDRAPSKVLQFNDFGLVAITRKRVKQSLERTLSVQCEVCTGTGMVKSPITVCNEIFIEMRKMQKHLDGKDVLLRVNPEVVKQLKSGNGRWITEYEEMVGKTVIIKSDPSLHPEQFDIQ